MRGQTGLLVFSREAGRRHMGNNSPSRKGKWPLKIRCFVRANQQKRATCFARFLLGLALASASLLTPHPSPLLSALIRLRRYPSRDPSQRFIYFFFTFNWTHVKRPRTDGRYQRLGRKAAGYFSTRRREGEKRKRRRRRREAGRPIVLIRKHDRKPSHFLRGCQTIDYDFICQRTE